MSDFVIYWRFCCLNYTCNKYGKLNDDSNVNKDNDNNNSDNDNNNDSNNNNNNI